jgi:hypothetical protein
MKSKILFIGAGAIGRGYLPWTLDETKHEFIFVDTNIDLIEELNISGGYSTYRVNGKEYQQKKVKVSAAFTPETFRLEDHKNVVACFFSVGPRNVEKAAQMLAGSSIPLIMCENEPETVALVKHIVQHDAVYFAVPDVITSNTAPPYLLNTDPLAIVTENGVQYIELGPVGLHGDICMLPREELLRIQWTPKLYLHNTPHCIIAYLGALMGVTYIHEAMMNQEAAKLIEGVMEEMLQMLKLRWDIPHEFLDWYAAKELARFRSRLLYDPVARVAREPLRKLELHGRLIGAAQMCLTQGVLPNYLLKGIVGALIFEDRSDPDHHIVLMRDAMEIQDFNRYVLGLRVGEPLDLMLRERMDKTLVELNQFKRDML